MRDLQGCSYRHLVFTGDVGLTLKNDYLIIKGKRFVEERRVIEHGRGINDMETMETTGSFW